MKENFEKKDITSKNKVLIQILLGVLLLTVIDIVLLFLGKGGIVIFGTIPLGIVSLIHGARNKYLLPMLLGICEIFYSVLYIYIVSGIASLIIKI